jgi:hypothetical protein
LRNVDNVIGEDCVANWRHTDGDLSGMAALDAANGAPVQFQGLFLPPAMPGETMYSLCARIANCSPVGAREVSLSLLGHHRGCAQQEVLVGLAGLEQAYGGPAGSLPIDELAVRSRTAHGAVLPFMLAARRAALVHSVRGATYSPTLRGLLGLRRREETTGLVLRRCPDCAAADLERVGVTWWRAVHQFAGVWVCPWHGRPLQWLPRSHSKTPRWALAQQPDDAFRDVSVNARALDALNQVAAAVLWCASHWSLWPSTLAIMVRARLRRAGLLKMESRIDAGEEHAIHMRVAQPLASCSLPHFMRFIDASWVARSTSGGDFSQPLRWALLLASSLPPGSTCRAMQPDPTLETGFAGEAGSRMSFGLDTPRELDADHALALERTPQLSLLASGHCRRFSRAPDCLYAALAEGLSIREAACEAGVNFREATLWLRKDPELGPFWRRSIAELRADAAERSLADYVRNHPGKLRSAVIYAQTSAVRSLERYAPSRLEKLLPPVQQKYSRQLRLFETQEPKRP